MKKLIDVLDFEKKSFTVVNKKRIWFSLPLLVILVAMICFFSYSLVYGSAERGINLGIDFTGGTVLTVTLGSDLDDESYYNEQKEVISGFIKDAGFVLSYSQKTGEGVASGIQFKYTAEGDLEADANDSILTAIKDHYRATKGEFTNETLSYNAIGSTASNKLILTAFLSLLISSVLILIYVGIRFELWAGLTAIIGQLHDVIMMFCFTLIFHIQINSSFVAAIITIIGYSINNTIVVLDRVRENVKLAGKNKTSLRDTVDTSIRQTLMRNIGTTFTTFIVVFFLCVLGVASMREFCLPIIFGLLCGLFDSVAMAPSMYVTLKEAAEKRKLKKADKLALNPAKSKGNK